MPVILPWCSKARWLYAFADVRLEGTLCNLRSIRQQSRCACSYCEHLEASHRMGKVTSRSWRDPLTLCGFLVHHNSQHRVPYLSPWSKSRAAYLGVLLPFSLLPRFPSDLCFIPLVLPSPRAVIAVAVAHMLVRRSRNPRFKLGARIGNRTSR